MRISDWSSDVCSSDLLGGRHHGGVGRCGEYRQPLGRRRRWRAGYGENAGQWQLDDAARQAWRLVFGVFGAGSNGLWRRSAARPLGRFAFLRSEEHTSELQSLMRISYAVFCLKKKKKNTKKTKTYKQTYYQSNIIKKTVNTMYNFT